MPRLLQPLFAALLPAAVVLAALLPGAGTASAQTFPDRPVKIVVPFPPGGSTDAVARIMAEGATGELGVTVVVDNRAGAGGNIGTAAVAKSAPDGYTLSLCTIGTCAINPSLYANTGYDLARDFAPVFLVGGTMNVVTVHPSVPAKTIQELIALARAKPGGLTYASSGVGSSNHLTPEWLKLLAKIDMVHVPYKGSGPAIIDLVGGQVQMFVDNEPSIVPQIKAGKVRALAVTGPQRSKQLPDVPTMEEAGFKGFIVEPWWGFLAPARTPRPVIERLNAAFNAAIEKPRVRQRLEEVGLRVVGGPPQRLGDQIRTETAKWAEVIKANNIRAE
jgi:tripartite-type tricarboxylate transporter receptor subunit TctC